MKEYKKNKSILEKIVSKNIISMSHPCGDYNNNTLKILKKLNILMGFRSNMSFNKKNLINNNNLEVATEDCSNILNKI